MSNRPCCWRICRYSGSERPAWRMNQTGVRSTGSRRAARTSKGSITAPYTSPPMQRVGEHPVPVGPLAVRWQAWGLDDVRAGAFATARLALANAGSAAWRSNDTEGVLLSYHWLDERGNAIVWDGIRTRFAAAVPAGGAVEVAAQVRAPIPPGRYRLAFDLVREHRYWLAELGNAPLELELDVRPRIDRRALAVRGADPQALAAQDEPAVPEQEAVAVAYLAHGLVPVPDWTRRVVDAHTEGYGIVSGSVAPGRRLRRGALEPYAPGRGRIPDFPHPLVCPSVVVGAPAEWLEPLAGLPALAPPRGPNEEPWVYDGRIALRR